jgi:hypothetical protein
MTTDRNGGEPIGGGRSVTYRVYGVILDEGIATRCHLQKQGLLD